MPERNAMSLGHHGAHPATDRALTGWLELLGPCVAWFFQLEGIYASSGMGCGQGRLGFHVTSAICLAVAVFATWRAWRTRAEADPAHTAPEQANDDPSLPAGMRSLRRVRFMADVATMTGALFTLAILTGWIAIVALVPCPS